MRELLLLLCLYPFEEKNRDLLLKLIAEDQDWNKTIQIINAHGIIALAAYNLKASGLEKKIPAEAMSKLENGYLRSVARNAWLTECWKEVNTILCSAGIQHILLKGMALEHTLYGANGLRQMNDTDILIKKEESAGAWQLLSQYGFNPEPAKSPLFSKIRFDMGQHLPALYKNGFAIEIHNNLFGYRIGDTISNHDPFADAVEILIGDTKVLILSREMQLSHLIKHFEHHKRSGDCQLRMYSDIMLLDKSNSIVFPDKFIPEPMQGYKKEFRKAAYKGRISAISPKYRFRFILGDTFPSCNWMKQRYKCNLFKAYLIYPLRIGKLRWLI
jgi:hypothetical protein